MLNGIYSCMFIVYVKCQSDKNQFFSVKECQSDMDRIALQLQ